MVLMNDSVLSSDAATLRPRYSSLNEPVVFHQHDWWGDLVSSTCLAGIRRATRLPAAQGQQGLLSLFLKRSVFQGFVRRCAGHLGAERTHPQRKVFPSLTPIDLPCPG